MCNEIDAFEVEIQTDPAYLVPQETSQDGTGEESPREFHPLHYQSASQTRLHYPHRNERSVLVQALWNGDDPNTHKRAKRIGACGCMPAFKMQPSGTVGVEMARCRDRLCPLCSQVRSKEVMLRVAKGIANWDSIRFVTLTMKADASTLEQRWEKLWDSFHKLRHEAVWKSNVTKAIAIPEITIGKYHQWHVHLHVLVDGNYIPQPLLKKAWLKVTGDSFVVGIELVESRSKAATYVAKYLGKGAHIHKWLPEQIREYALKTAGKRFMRVYGGAQLPKLDDDDESDVQEPSTHLCNANDLMRAQENGIEQVRHAIDILSKVGRPHATVLDRDWKERSSTDQPGEEPSGHDLAFAVAVCEEVHRASPKLPDADKLERIRRHIYSLPEPPSKARAPIQSEMLFGSEVRRHV